MRVSFSQHHEDRICVLRVHIYLQRVKDCNYYHSQLGGAYVAYSYMDNP